ncbi:MAG TPA: sugar ABC transporter ATP-binding protein [Chryseolinea sp.]|nr:sugar ABC transporter ATP-binding protein [Chryseolinea sp.]
MTVLKLEGISKTFPGVKALDNVDLLVEKSEILSICGENGAGKSTMMNIIAGNMQPDHGRIYLNDQHVEIKTPQSAFDLGIAVVYQHLSLVENLSVAENIYANRQPVNKLGLIQFDELHVRSQKLLKELGMDDINPSTLVSRLSQPKKQLVEIAKALSRHPSILILDEPTTSITERETRTLFEILFTLKNQGVSILYISHRLDEIFKISDRVSVLKDGRSQGTFKASNITKDQLITKMVGREIKALRSGSTSRPEVLLEVKDLTGARFRNISFRLHRGEILGMAGLIGAGRTEIARALFGADKVRSGSILLNGHLVSALDHPEVAIRNGIAYVPEERKTSGLFQEMSIQDNVIAGDLKNASSRNGYSQAKAKMLAIELKDKLKIVAPDVQQKVINLSGGNQQKVVLAKWLLTHPEVLIVDEPTHGIDVGAKFEIYELLKIMAAEGKAILVISSDLPELIGLCDRILVIKEGSITGEVTRAEASEEIIMTLAAN